jgi:hypothetical protein
METFGQVIVKARKAAGLTQKGVAERLGAEMAGRFCRPFSTTWSMIGATLPRMR